MDKLDVVLVATMLFFVIVVSVILFHSIAMENAGYVYRSEWVKVR